MVRKFRLLQSAVVHYRKATDHRFDTASCGGLTLLNSLKTWTVGGYVFVIWFRAYYLRDKLRHPLS